ncbi:MAG: helix-turn-helix domain-containing protein [Steroidobacteraceae bacterium]
MSVDTPNRKLSDQELKQLHERTKLDNLLTTLEAAALLRMQPQTLRRWACENSGPIKPRRIGGRLTWPLADIKNLMAGESAAA